MLEVTLPASGVKPVPVDNLVVLRVSGGGLVVNVVLGAMMLAQLTAELVALQQLAA